MSCGAGVGAPDSAEVSLAGGPAATHLPRRRRPGYLRARQRLGAGWVGRRGVSAASLPACRFPLFRLGSAGSATTGPSPRKLLGGARDRGLQRGVATLPPGIPHVPLPGHPRPAGKVRKTAAPGCWPGARTGAGAGEGATDRMSLCQRAECPFVATALVPSEGTAAGPWDQGPPRALFAGKHAPLNFNAPRVRRGGGRQLPHPVVHWRPQRAAGVGGGGSHLCGCLRGTGYPQPSILGPSRS